MSEAMDDAIKGARRPILPCGYFHSKLSLYLLRLLFADAVINPFGAGREENSAAPVYKRSQCVSAGITSIHGDNHRRYRAGRPSRKAIANPPWAAGKPPRPDVKPPQAPAGRHQTESQYSVGYSGSRIQGAQRDWLLAVTSGGR